MKVGTYIEVLDSRTTLDWTLCVMCRCNGENSTFSWAAVTPSDNIPMYSMYSCIAIQRYTALYRCCIDMGP